MLADLGAVDASYSGGEERGDVRVKEAKRKRQAYPYRDLEQAFPVVDSGHVPFGSLVLVQMRTPMEETDWGFELVDETKETEKWNTQVAKVIAIGPLAFKDRDTQKPWPEGAWFKEGDFVRVPKYGGDRFEVPIDDSPNKALFIIFNDNDFRAKITGDPLKVVAYID